MFTFNKVLAVKPRENLLHEGVRIARGYLKFGDPYIALVLCVCVGHVLCKRICILCIPIPAKTNMAVNGLGPAWLAHIGTYQCKAISSMWQPVHAARKRSSQLGPSPDLFGSPQETPGETRVLPLSCHGSMLLRHAVTAVLTFCEGQIPPPIHYSFNGTFERHSLDRQTSLLVLALVLLRLVELEL